MSFVTVEYPKSVHCPRGKGELRELLDDVRFASKVLKGGKYESSSTPAVHHHEVSSDAKEKISRLKKFYKFDEQIETYLEKNIFLYDSLLEAIHQIRVSFGEKHKHIISIPSQTRRLFIDIQTRLEFEEAIEAMDRFDNEWWFKQSREIRSKLEFSLDIR